ncbi:protein of unknown function [Candidatus Hydrogenisulfobacillus filiaventi]|uniref:Glycosyltransferase 2-like domain-containing protein n=1 Tax=Candidatus Hydrogenisulfobacillus filiaventi TaxID=2707344 RepID=A0A6F8ZDJ9_9FIRM|nr:protein of unknown function [Candidatus Hydrogenisulfobacillus filiaventi]
MPPEAAAARLHMDVRLPGFPLAQWLVARLARELRTRCPELAALPAAGTAPIHLRAAWPPDWSRPPAPGRLVVLQPWGLGPVPDRWLWGAQQADAIWVPLLTAKLAWVQSGLDPRRVQVVPWGLPALTAAAPPARRILFLGPPDAMAGWEDLLASVRGWRVPVYRLDPGDLPDRWPEPPGARPGTRPLAGLRALLHRGGLVVSPHHTASFAYAAALAAAAGLPVLASDWGGPREWDLAPAWRLPGRIALLPPTTGHDLWPLAGAGYTFRPDPEALRNQLADFLARPASWTEAARTRAAALADGHGWETAGEQARLALARLGVCPSPAVSPDPDALDRAARALDTLTAGEDPQRLLEAVEILAAVGDRVSAALLARWLAYRLPPARKGLLTLAAGLENREGNPPDLWESGYFRRQVRRLLADGLRTAGAGLVLTRPALPEPAVSVIIPQYGQAALTARCLEDIDRVLRPRHALEVIVVDDGSPDPAARTIADAFGSWVTVVAVPVNSGFAVACNLGAAHARGRYLVFLNNDTRTTGDWLTPLLAAAERDPRVAVVGARLWYPDGTLQHGGVEFYAPGMAPLAPAHRQPPAGGGPDPTQVSGPVPAVTGACMLLPRARFQELGGFDEQFLLSYEDTDLCLAATERGYRVWYAADAQLIHAESRTRALTPLRHARDLRNLLALQRKWLPRLATLPGLAPPRPRGAGSRIVFRLQADNALLPAYQTLVAATRLWEDGDLLILDAGTSADGTADLFRLARHYRPDQVRLAGRDCDAIPSHAVQVEVHLDLPASLGLSALWRQARRLPPGSRLEAEPPQGPAAPRRRWHRT